MMSALSFLFWLLTRHAVLTFFAALLLIALVSWRRRRPGFGVVVFPLALLNIFLGQYANAAFLNLVGERGEAVIVHAAQTSSMLNEQYIWRYDVVLHTADGDDVETTIHTDTAALWPLENAIRIPAVDQPFAVKYTPGFPRNFVILTRDSPHGIALARSRARERVEVAGRKLHFSPSNAGFRAAYRQELEQWLQVQGDDPAQRSDADRFRAELQALDAADPARATR